jgi:hypothetical protein
MEPMTPEERFTKIENLLHSLTEHQVQMQAEQEKHAAAIRDLIVLNRSFLDSQMQITKQVEKLQDAQRVTDEKLRALIETVDRIIGHREN